jgi:hypothetical protein
MARNDVISCPTSISEMCARLAYLGKIDTVCHPCDMVAERENIIYLRDLVFFFVMKTYSSQVTTLSVTGWSADHQNMVEITI